MVDVPRPTDLHAMKRIGVCWAEMISQDIPAALHVNGRTESDYDRWADFIRDRAEVTAISFEFATGSRGNRGEWHARQLERMAERVARSLALVVRGGTRHLRSLRASFAAVSFVDHDALVRTVKRKRAVLHEQSGIHWRKHQTAPHAPLDELFSHNCAAVKRWHFRDCA